MSAYIDLINLLGAAALLIWGLRLIKTGILRAFGASLRQWIALGTRNRVTAALGGLVSTIAMQSSTATAAVAGSFATRGILGVDMAQAVMLGANVGTALVALVLSLDVDWLAPVMIFLGVATFSMSQHATAKNVGRAALGLGLMLLALHLLGTAVTPLRQSPIVIAALVALTDAPLIALALTAGLAVLASSSLATVMFVVVLVQSGDIPLPLAVVMVAGANLGGAVPPVLLARSEGVESRRLALTNLVIRSCGAVPLALASTPVAALLARQVADPGTAVIVTHVAFNLALLVVFLPLISPISRLAMRLLPAVPDEETAPAYLDPAALESPAMALAGAGRETLRVGDLVRDMLELWFATLTHARSDAKEVTSDLDDAVDRLQHAIKLYLARLDRDTLSSEDVRRADEVTAYAINLEHVGDIVDGGLARIASRKRKRQVEFSSEGLAELTALYRKTIENMALAQSVFLTRDPELARQLVAAKVEVRRLETRSAQRHLARVREQRTETLDSSTLHLDILRDLKRINSHLASVAYPILEEIGALRESRLRTPRPSGDEVSSRP